MFDLGGQCQACSARRMLANLANKFRYSIPVSFAPSVVEMIEVGSTFCCIRSRRHGDSWVPEAKGGFSTGKVVVNDEVSKREVCLTLERRHEEERRFEEGLQQTNRSTVCNADALWCIRQAACRIGLRGAGKETQ